MTIENGILHGVQFLSSPNRGGELTKPRLLIIHYTASGGTGAVDARFFANPAAKASAHFVVDRDGSITQCVSTKYKAWHAGKSAWRGVSNCNDFSIGIEVDNWGYLDKTQDGKFRSHSGTVIDPDNVIEAKHKNPDVRYQYWERYPAAQIEALVMLTRDILKAHPSIKEIIGHEDIAPGRKLDPGPAFPWPHFLSEVEGREETGPDIHDMPFYVVTASKLNVRGGRGTDFDVIGTLNKDQKVQVVYEYPNSMWAEVLGHFDDGNRNMVQGRGFVSKTFIRPL